MSYNRFSVGSGIEHELTVTQRVAARVAETKALLDKYVAFQGQSLHTRDLILNTRWTGAKDVSGER